MSHDLDSPWDAGEGDGADESRRIPINPFDAARARSRVPDIQVRWSVQDMQRLRPDWSQVQCEGFLKRHAEKFAAGMIRMGLTVLASMASDPRFTGNMGPSFPNGEGGNSPHPPEKGP